MTAKVWSIPLDSLMTIRIRVMANQAMEQYNRVSNAQSNMSRQTIRDNSALARSIRAVSMEERAYWQQRSAAQTQQIRDRAARNAEIAQRRANIEAMRAEQREARQLAQIQAQAAAFNSRMATNRLGMTTLASAGGSGAANSGAAAAAASSAAARGAASTVPIFTAATSAARRFMGDGLTPATNAANKFGTSLRNALNPQSASKLQWLGRQLSYNFSIPLAIAGAAATKWALDVEKAVTRTAKVYGDNAGRFVMPAEAMPGEKIAKGMNIAQHEVMYLAKAFEVLSNRFGVAQSDVANIGADWAQAGVSGLALAKSTELTLKTMILGELNAKDATTALISTQAQYGLSIEQLSKTMDVFNMVENTTATNMSDLLTVFTKSASSAKQAGVGIRQLSAMASVLIPATGSAATAGNALKTIITRLLNPTKASTQLLKAMGIETSSMAWQSMNAEQRMIKLSDSFSKLSDAQKTTVSATMGSVYQVNRFSELMEKLADKNGIYYDTLKATKSENKNFAQSVKELNMVLESNPQKMKQVWAMIQNGMINIIVPLLPLIVNLGQAIAGLFRKFSALDPGVQKLIVGFLAFIVVLGPMIRLLGAFRLLLAFLLAPIGWVFKALFGLIGILKTLALVALLPFKLILAGAAFLMTGLGRLIMFIPMLFAGGFAAIPAIVGGAFAAIAGIFFSLPGMLIGVLIAAGVIFRDSLVSIWNNLTQAGSGAAEGMTSIGEGIAEMWNNIVGGIIDAFGLLPQAVQDAFMSVFEIVKTVALKVYEMFSYLNPFAHHSPSLVETVTWGMAEIRKQYASVGNVGAVFAKAAKDLREFKMATAGMGKGEFSDDRASVKAVKPTALPKFDALQGDYSSLLILQEQYTQAIARQSAVVDQWQGNLDQADTTLQRHQDELSAAKARVDDLAGAYDAAKDKMSQFASAPLKGMGEMSDAIFDNQQQQKKLQLQMMDWEKTHGAVKDVQSRFADLQGLIEELQGRVSVLRSKGAGKEVTGPLTDEIAKLQNAQKKLAGGGGSDPYTKMQKKLDELGKAGQRLELMNSVKFDPLTRELGKLADATKEISFEDAAKGIGEQRKQMELLEPQIKTANEDVEKYTRLVNGAQAARDRISKTYDIEKEKLAGLNDQYDEIGKSIQAITTALHDMGNAASEIERARKAAKDAKKAKDPKGEKNTPALDNFLAAEGANFDDAELPKFDLSEFNKSMGDESAKIDEWTKKQMAKINKQFSMGDMFAPIKRAWKKVWDWIEKNIGGPLGRIWDGIKQVWADLGSVFSDVDFLADAKAALQPMLDWLQPVMDALNKVWNTIGPSIASAARDVWAALSEGWQKLSPTLLPFFETTKQLLKDLTPLWWLLAGAIGFLVGAIGGVLGPILQFVINRFMAVMSIVSGLMKIFGGLVQFIWGVLVAAFKAIKGILEGVWKVISGVIDFFKALFSGDWEGIKKALGKIWDGVVQIAKSIGEFFVNIWNEVWKFIKKLGSGIWDLIKGIFGWFVGGVADFVGMIWGAIKGGITTVLNGLVAFGGQMYDGFVKGFKKVLEWVGKIGKFITQDLWKGIAAFISWFWNKLGGWLGGLKNKIMEALKFIVEVGKTFINWLWEGIKNGWVAVMTWFGQMAERIWEALAGLGVKIIAFGRAILNWLWDGIKAVWTTVYTWFAEIGIRIWDAIKGLGKKIAGFGRAIFNWVFDGIKAIWTKVFNWFANIAVRIWSAIRSLGQTIGGHGKKILNWLWDGIKTIWTKVATWFGQIATRIWSAIKGLAGTVAGFGKNLITWIWNGIKELWKSVSSWFGSLWTKILLALGGIAIKAYNFGKKLLGDDGIWGGIKKVWKSVSGWFGDLWTKIITALGNIATKAFNWGKKLLGEDGIWGGIKKVWTNITDWFAGLWDNILTALGNVFEKAVQWGKDLVGGIVEGIGAVASQVWDAITGLFTGDTKGVLKGPTLEQRQEVWEKEKDRRREEEAKRGGGKIPRRADGGEIFGGSSPRADDVLTLLSHGEFVVRAEVAQKNKSLLRHLNSYGRLPAYADGGLVSRAVAATGRFYGSSLGVGIGNSISGHANRVKDAPVWLNNTAANLGGGFRSNYLEKKKKEAAAAAAAASSTSGAGGGSTGAGAAVTANEKVIADRLYYWNNNPPNGGYNQGAYSVGADGKMYRNDCSGYVSMLTGMSGSPNTAAISSGYSSGISKDALRFGDILIATPGAQGGHVALFDRWTDGSKSSYIGHEFGSGMVPKHHAIPYPYFADGRSFTPRKLSSVVHAAMGGFVSGPGSGTSDEIMARLSNGEFVHTAQTYKRYKNEIDAIHNGTYDRKLKRKASMQNAGNAPQATRLEAQEGRTTRVVHYHIEEVVLPGIRTERDAERLFESIDMYARGN